MKITALIMLVFLLHVSAFTKAQITLNAKGAPLQKVLEDISTQSGYDFIYSDSDLKDTKPVNIKLNNVTIDKALQLCFEGQPLVYEISDKTVMVRSKENKSILNRIKDFIAAKDLTGVVTDKAGIPLEGATVRVENTVQAVTTNQFGFFSLKNVADEATISITYIGYKGIEIKPYLFQNGTINIILEKGESKLDEVQVIAYGTTSRRIATSDISTVKAGDIEKQDVNNPLLALQGRVTGVTITPSSGLPGAPITVQVRGVNTLGYINGLSGKLKTADPLFVIDGVPYANNIRGTSGAAAVNSTISAFSFIDPSDIESIDVLKDADATAIYGSRGANGVILITTKKGKIGSSSINVSISNGFGKVPKMLHLMNTQEYLEMRRDAYKSDGIDLPTYPFYDNYDLTVYDQNRSTDWQKKFIGGTAKYTNAGLNISGGTPTVQYLISGNFNKEGYVSPGNASNTSGNGHFSITGNSLNGKFKSSLTGDYSATNSIAAADFTSVAMILVPNAPTIYKPDGTLNWEPDPNSGFATWRNPYATLLTPPTSKANVIRSSATLSYKLLPSLLVKTDIGFSTVNGSTYQPFPSTSVDPMYVTLGLIKASSGFNTYSSRSWSVDPQVLYHINLGQGRLEAIAGVSLQAQGTEFQQIAARGFSSDALLRNLGSATSYALSNSSSEYKSEGFFGRITYDWDDRYIFNVNARRDGSSRFGPANRFGNFGSIGAAWVFSKEAFIQQALPFLSFGKLRFSYGITGNDGIGDYQYLELYQNLLDNPTYQGVKGISSVGVTNSYYHWEQTKKAEIGIETGLLKDRIVLGINYFRNRSGDQLGTFSLPSTAGDPSNFVVNQNAKIQNSGWEFMLNTDNIKGNDFKWSTSMNLSINRNKLLALPAGTDFSFGLDHRIKPGDQFSGITYVYQYKGVDPATGRYQFSDGKGGLTFTPNASAATTVNTAPVFYGGFSNTFSYKGFTLDVFLQFNKQMGTNYLFGEQIFQNPGSFFFTTGGNLPAALLTRWRTPGDVSHIQRFSTLTSGDVADGWNYASQSTLAYEDASFIKVKNVSLSYTVPQGWKTKLGIKNLRVYLQGQNIWTITGYKGLDPETQTIARLPQLRVFTAGIQAGF